MAGLIVTHYNLLHWEIELDFWKEIVFTIGVPLGFGPTMKRTEMLDNDTHIKLVA
ncbi:hypothetical protein [Bacillus sp. OTU530]|uniref:hypothetical protein n=1 Tax=Bacillus sp. OTU530 TaxID=3043862 RepID=UPI00313DCEC1